MPEPTAKPINAPTLCCPTCRATQSWSDTCRRCKCDLRLLREALDACDTLRQACLSHLRGNRPETALELARQYDALRADTGSRRLLAVCELLNGHWNAARVHALQLLSGSETNRAP